jgi:hypothetical protein
MSVAIFRICCGEWRRGFAGSGVSASVVILCVYRRTYRAATSATNLILIALSNFTASFALCFASLEASCATVLMGCLRGIPSASVGLEVQRISN